MKKRTALLVLSLVALLAASCGGQEEALNVSADQLLGKWQRTNSQEYWRYITDSTGVTWDESEDVSEEESNLTFRWEVNGARLMHVFTGEMANQAVPKVYTITEISSTSMKWKDDYSMEYQFNKVD